MPWIWSLVWFAKEFTPVACMVVYEGVACEGFVSSVWIARELRVELTPNRKLLLSSFIAYRTKVYPKEGITYVPDLAGGSGLCLN